ncbi:MAG: NAD(P)H-hydrate dehydratase [Pyrinomonadaceae bacterium]|nr:NAD(P)H-hydrate dehydratase [Pyrinomonadaceae bacterium]MBP6211718.1 NAD(P)H-hydrate dehydratase [Pyrinomonadaceae bacterium]
MQKVLTAEQMREVDRLTTERYGIPSILLMENAAHAVARVITEKLGGSVKGKRFCILCGPGNNGGDGAALARILLFQGAEHIYAPIWGEPEMAPDDARQNFKILKALFEQNAPRLVAPKMVNERVGLPMMKLVDVVVDAVFGTGLKRPAEGHIGKAFETLLRWRDEPGRPIILAVDIPSGLPSDSGSFLGSHIQADLTVTFTAPKPSNVLAPAASANGELVVANIGSPQELIDEQPSQLYLAESEDASMWLAKTGFSSGDYKNRRGHALEIAGSESYSGAAVLVGDAAMRSGVGLVTIATPRSLKDSIALRVLPEVMVKGVAETDDGAIAEEAFDELHDLLEKADAVAVGSGLSQSESTQRFVQNVIENRKCPTIVDADALNLLSPWTLQKPARVQGRNIQADQGEASGTLAVQFPLILTPHEGEFLRLLGTGDKDTIKDRVAAVRDFATTNNVILVLKGERVLIGAPDGRVVVNPTGNSGLGKAGNGDTLAGILAGFAAQAAAMKIDTFETVVAAVYTAGMAGDISEAKYGKRVMIASDVRECLTEAFRLLERN